VGNTKVSNLDSNLANTSSPLNQQPDEAPIPDDLDTELSQTSAIQETQNRQIIDINSGRSMPNIQKVVDELSQIDSDDYEETTDDDTYINPKPVSSRTRTKLYVSRPQTATELPSDGSELSEDYMSPDPNENESDDRFTKIFDYSSPNVDPYDIPGGGTTMNNRFSWILLWIMKFRIKFSIPETATESLIKFIKLVLNEIGGDNFSAFPDSLYLAKKELGLRDRFQSFVPCTKCHKLYQKQEVENFRQDEALTIMKCRHIKFPNSSLRRLKTCDTFLSWQVGSVFRPELIYPFVGIQEQLSSMYR
jgi:hypothetical protein